MSRIKRSASTGLPTVNFSDHGPVRYLHLGTDWVQGSMWPDRPYEIHLDYVQRMMGWLLWVPPEEVANLKAMHDATWARRPFNPVEAQTAPPMADILSLLVRERLTGVEPPANARPLVDMYRSEIEARGGETLEKLDPHFPPFDPTLLARLT